MNKMRREPKHLKTSVKIHILCEGETEEALLSNLLSKYNTISIECFGGGGYSTAEKAFDSNISLYSVILLVMDLDKAQTKPVEKSILNRFITKIHKVDKRHCIFLSSPNIEYWVACSINKPKSYLLEDLKALGYNKGSTVNDFIKNCNGSYEQAKIVANSSKTYYSKSTPKSNFTLNPNYFTINQSNHSSLIEYINQLNQ